MAAESVGHGSRPVGHGTQVHGAHGTWQLGFVLGPLGALWTKLDVRRGGEEEVDISELLRLAEKSVMRVGQIICDTSAEAWYSHQAPKRAKLSHGGRS